MKLSATAPTGATGERKPCLAEAPTGEKREVKKGLAKAQAGQKKEALRGIIASTGEKEALLRSGSRETRPVEVIGALICVVIGICLVLVISNWFYSGAVAISDECRLDYEQNYHIASSHVTETVNEQNLDVASQETIDCLLTQYKTEVFTLADYDGIPMVYQWKMQLGSDDEMREIFDQRRENMHHNNFTQLYDLLKADAMWAYLYSRYYPSWVQQDLMDADVVETSKMVTMIKLPQCFDDYVAEYRADNEKKYSFYVSNPISSAMMQSTYIPECDKQVPKCTKCQEHIDADQIEALAPDGSSLWRRLLHTEASERGPSTMTSAPYRQWNVV